MKKTLILLLASMLALGAQAQLIRSADLENYAKEKYGEKWTEAAWNLSKELTLDRNHALSYVEVIPCEGQSKSQLYANLNYWVARTFNYDDSNIIMNDKDAGTIIVQTFLEDVAEHTSLLSHYKVDLRPVLRLDIKDGKVRVTVSTQEYDIRDITSTLWTDPQYRGNDYDIIVYNYRWPVDTCYPFVDRDEHGAKRTSSKALIMAHAYSNVLIDKVEEALKNGIVGNENDDW